MNTEAVRVTRASTFLGSDVMASDGRKVGDIVDYYFDLTGAPHLAYVVVMTGGFLDMGGDRRAVPASAITTTAENNCRLSLSSNQFWDVPVLPGDGKRFLSDPQNQQRISSMFRQSEAAGTPQRQAQAGNKEKDTARTQQSAGAGAMTGRQGQSQLVSFSELRNADAFGQQDTRLGFFADAWVNLNENSAPYIEITPTFTPFRTNFDRRYAIPTAKLAQKPESYGYTVNVTTDELNKADPVSETEGVKMLQEGRIGNTVLRVTVPAR